MPEKMTFLLWLLVDAIDLLESKRLTVEDDWIRLDVVRSIEVWHQSARETRRVTWGVVA